MLFELDLNNDVVSRLPGTYFQLHSGDQRQWITENFIPTMLDRRAILTLETWKEAYGNSIRYLEVTAEIPETTHNSLTRDFQPRVHNMGGTYKRRERGGPRVMLLPLKWQGSDQRQVVWDFIRNLIGRYAEAISVRPLRGNEVEIEQREISVRFTLVVPNYEVATERGMRPVSGFVSPSNYGYTWHIPSGVRVPHTAFASPTFNLDWLVPARPLEEQTDLLARVIVSALGERRIHSEQRSQRVMNEAAFEARQIREELARAQAALLRDYTEALAMNVAWDNDRENRERVRAVVSMIERARNFGVNASPAAITDNFQTVVMTVSDFQTILSRLESAGV